MKKLFFVFVALFTLAMVACQNQTLNPESASVETEIDSVSYALGVVWANQVKNGGLDEINYSAMAKGMDEVFNDKAGMDQQSAGMLLNAYFTKLQDKVNEDNLIAGQEFLAQNAERDEVTTLPSGLQYEVLVEGDGPKPDMGDKISTHYTGTLIDGTKFDSSIDRGEPFEFTVGSGVIQAWTEIVQLMNVGSKYKIYVPTELGYGTRVRPGGPIKPNDALIFEIELLDIVEESAGE